MSNKELEQKIIEESKIVKDFPRAGVNFINLAPVFENIELYGEIIEEMTERIAEYNIDKIVAIESRGFLLGSPLALASEKPLVLARKGGKVPYKPVNQEYSLEYGKASLEISEPQINEGDRIAIVDDIIATGGTAEATIKIIEKLKGKAVCLVVLGSISNLDYKNLLSKYNIEIISLVDYKF
ncbi:MAG: adenine phosphoribosyltransferase [Rickettsiales bacterium]|nr:MAG: adenine phosphoribosyltransferase [Rickettsiales bacterium]